MCVPVYYGLPNVCSAGKLSMQLLWNYLELVNPALEQSTFYLFETSATVLTASMLHLSMLTLCVHVSRYTYRVSSVLYSIMYYAWMYVCLCVESHLSDLKADWPTYIFHSVVFLQPSLVYIIFECMNVLAAIFAVNCNILGWSSCENYVYHGLMYALSDTFHYYSFKDIY